MPLCAVPSDRHSEGSAAVELMEAFRRRAAQDFKDSTPFLETAQHVGATND